MSSAYRQGSTQDISQARILSVQSHVVNGYVGNKAAIFPLQLLGNDVDFINSVQFVSQFVHQGQKLSGEELRTLLDGLQKHNLGNYQYFLTGFIGQPSFLREVLAFIKSQKANPPLSLSPSPFVCAVRATDSCNDGHHASHRRWRSIVTRASRIRRACRPPAQGRVQDEPLVFLRGLIPTHRDELSCVDSEVPASAAEALFVAGAAATAQRSHTQCIQRAQLDLWSRGCNGSVQRLPSSRCPPVHS
mmetsp:Transcript_38548/g.110242  ORF Transcript_38548/g.110242 Transcript_38548/m.110242 type:complete len:246 (+) Transcript_38548:130-867(+)